MENTYQIIHFLGLVCGCGSVADQSKDLCELIVSSKPPSLCFNSNLCVNSDDTSSFPGRICHLT